MERKNSKLWIAAVVLGTVLFSAGIFFIGSTVMRQMGIDLTRGTPGPNKVGGGGATTTPTDSNAALAMMTRLNDFRVQAGLNPVRLNPDYSRGCEKHIAYLLRNRKALGEISLDYHGENPELPGYSEEGLMAAGSSVIAFSQSPAGAVDAWMATLYHRTPLLRPSLEEVGVAVGGDILMMDINSARAESEPHEVIYPANGQSDVPLRFQDELPDPVPSGVGGYPVTVQFPGDWDCEGLKAELRDATGKVVPTFFSCPEKPATAMPQEGTVCLIPQRPLTAATKYAVKVTGKVKGEQYAKEWTFATAASQVTKN